MYNDKISELIVNIKNASMVNQKEVVVAHSILKENILTLLKKEGYIADFKTLKGDGVKKNLKVTLAYSDKGESKIKDVC